MPPQTHAGDFLGPLLRTLAETLDVREIFPRVSESVREVLPHDFLLLGLVSGDRGAVTLIALSEGLPAETPGVLFPEPLQPFMEGDGFVLNDMQPLPGNRRARGVLRPNAGDQAVPVELDIQDVFRPMVLEAGVRSFQHVPVRLRQSVLGGLLFCSRDPHAFPRESVVAASRIAACLALAVEHDRLARGERERRRRHEALHALLPALAAAPDIRPIFDEISRIARDVLPHDHLSLALFNEDRTAVRVHATSEAFGMPSWYRFTSPENARIFEVDHAIVDDITPRPPDRLEMRVHLDGTVEATLREVVTEPEWVDVFVKTGVRAQLRVAVRLRGAIVGSLAFQSKTPGRFAPGDVEFARRVADHVALALSQRDLAVETERATRLEERVQVLAQELETLSPHRALGRSARWREVLAQAALVAPTETTVLITGESGTGKEVVARFVHRASSRKDGPFVALNCAALPEQLLESELFGHERGAFTGALNARLGKIEQAAGGVLFLDEVGEMSPAVQAKFLRVLQEREFERLGATRTLKADVRVLAATNRNLKAAIAQGTFRDDLYYRLAVFDIPLPPLRERPSDIPLLVEAFLEEVGRSMGRPAAGISEEVVEKLVAYPWPGNVRELRNAIERAVILCGGGLITSAHLPMGIVAGAATVAAPPPSALSEREQILDALAKTGNNQLRAARLLGLTRAQIRARIEKHGISLSD